MKTLLPLMSLDKNILSCRYGAWALACLSANQETHQKITKSGSNLTLGNLIMKNIHYDVTRYCIQTLSNLAEDFNNHDVILTQELFKIMVCELLDIVDHECQAYICKILYHYSLKSEKNLHYDNMHRLLMKKSYLEPILNRIVGDENSVLNALKVIKYFFF